MTYSGLVKSEVAPRKPIVSSPVEFGLRTIGIWPGASYAHLRRLIYIFVIALFPTFQYNYVIVHSDEDISSLMDVLSVALTYSVLFVKLIVFSVKVRVIDEIIVCMADDWKERDVSDEYAMTQTVNISRSLSNFIIASYLIGTSIYSTGNLMKTKSDNQTASRQLFHKMELPFKIESTPVHMATLLTQFIHQSTSASIMGVMDSLLLTLVLHACGQIDIVRQRLNELTQKDIEEGTATTEIVKKMIVRHQKIISFSQNIEVLFSGIALIQFVSNMMVICCVGFLIAISINMPNGSTMLIKSLWFYVNMSVETFIYCFAGEYLSTKSGLIGDAAYESLWYHLKPSQNRDILFMIVRSQKQLKLTVGKFVDLSLTQFGNVVKASASYVSVLHAMY